MMKKNKMELPINFSKEQFINSVPDIVPQMNEGRAQAVTFTLTLNDIRKLDEQIDRAINLGKRNKSKSATIRMALQALEETSEESYLNLYNKF